MKSNPSIPTAEHNNWVFLNRYNGAVILNNTSHDHLTNKYQSRTRSLMRELDIDIDLVLSHTTQSLSDPVEALRCEIDSLAGVSHELRLVMGRPKSREKANVIRRAQIDSNNQQIERIISVLER